jgi:hypothetical protein
MLTQNLGMIALRVEHIALTHIIGIDGNSPRDCNNLSQLQASIKKPLAGALD